MSSDDEDFEAAEPQKGMSQSLALRLEKKLLGMTVKSKSTVKNFVDDNTGELLDHLFDLAVKDTGEKKFAKKVIKDLIKIVVKIGLLYRKNQLSPEEMGYGDKLRQKFRMAVLTMISYHDVAFTYDQEFLCNLLENCKDLGQQLIQRHLTDKSKGRVENVFGYFGSGELLTKLYTHPDYKENLENIIKCLNKMTEANVL